MLDMWLWDGVAVCFSRARWDDSRHMQTVDQVVLYALSDRTLRSMEAFCNQRVLFMYTHICYRLITSTHTYIHITRMDSEQASSHES